MRFFLLLTALVGLASSSPLADKNAEERFGFGLIEGAIGAVANALATPTTTTAATTTNTPTYNVTGIIQNVSIRTTKH